MITAMSWPRKMPLRRTLGKSTFNSMVRRLTVIYQANVSLLFYVAHCVLGSATWKRRSSIFSALKYSMKCIHWMCYKCRWKLELQLNLICLMHCVRPICRFARVVGPKLNWGGGSIHFELFKFTFVDMVLQFMGFRSYFVFLSKFFNTRLERASKWNMKHNYDLSSHNGSQFQFRAAHILNIFLLQTLPSNDLFTSSSLSFWTKTNESSWTS